MQSSFQLPIGYLKRKEKLDVALIDDLELLRTDEGQPSLYSHVLGEKQAWVRVHSIYGRATIPPIGGSSGTPNVSLTVESQILCRPRQSKRCATYGRRWRQGQPQVRM